MVFIIIWAIRGVELLVAIAFTLSFIAYINGLSIVDKAEYDFDTDRQLSNYMLAFGLVFCVIEGFMLYVAEVTNHIGFMAIGLLSIVIAATVKSLIPPKKKSPH